MVKVNCPIYMLTKTYFDQISFETCAPCIKYIRNCTFVMKLGFTLKNTLILNFILNK